MTDESPVRIRADDNIVAIRRARITNYLDDHLTVGFDEPMRISDDLGINYKTVKNDIIWLKAKYREQNKKYNLSGLFKSHLKKAKRLEELQEKAALIVKDGLTDSDKLHAISLEADLINTIYHLESDGLTPIAEELEEKEKKEEKEKREKDAVENKSH